MLLQWWKSEKAKKVVSPSAYWVLSVIVDKLGAEESEVTETANFTNDLGADSLDTVELLMEFERVFGIKIPDEDASQIATVADAVKYVEEKVANK